jgi:hypothetical protein
LAVRIRPLAPCGVRTKASTLGLHPRDRRSIRLPRTKFSSLPVKHILDVYSLGMGEVESSNLSTGPSYPGLAQLGRAHLNATLSYATV